jgi:dephospho-CoA kinase
MTGRLLVGLTGGLASGKSTVARLLAERGCLVVDADQLVAKLYLPGGAGAAALAELLGPAVLSASGGVDHAAVAARIFQEPTLRREVERRIHPLVRDAFKARAAGARGIVVLEATLLVEAGFAPDFDVVVTVEADPAVRLERAIARGLTKEDAERRLASQSPEEVRTNAADLVIRNDGTPIELEYAVEELLRGLRTGLAPPG